MINLPQGTQEYGLFYVRVLRDKKLAESDWTQSPDSPLTDSKKTEWATYRQELRDMMEDLTVPLNEKGFVDETSLVWPTKP